MSTAPVLEAEAPAIVPGPQVQGGLLTELASFGATDIAACFNCGVCSAICPLSDGSFPRRIIHLAQLGLRDELLSAPELWSCYGCGECTEVCPTQADPAAFMAAARQYAITRYDRTGLARRLATSMRFSVTFIAMLVVVLAAFLYSSHHTASHAKLAFFSFIPAHVIHDLGIGVLVLFAAGAIAGFIRMLRQVTWAEAHGEERASPSAARTAAAVWSAVGSESLGQTRFRRECTEELGRPDGRPWYLRRWFVHAATMWGFLGLLAATVLDYLLDLIGVKRTGTAVPVWYPVRLLGTLAGLLFLYGASIVILRRLRKTERSWSRSLVSDWSFVWLLWLTGLTGFVIEIALYLHGTPSWAYWVFLIHVALAMTLVLLLPFSKFAHAIYRPVALVAFRLQRGDPARTKIGSVQR